jgi:hypothetical protein
MFQTKQRKIELLRKGGCIYAGGSISVAEHGRRLVKIFTTILFYFLYVFVVVKKLIIFFMLCL